VASNVQSSSLSALAGRAEVYGAASRCLLSSLKIGVAEKRLIGRCMATRCSERGQLEVRLSHTTENVVKTEWLQVSECMCVYILCVRACVD
jgi:hypothetical protein